MASNHLSAWNHVVATNHGKKNNSPYLLCKMNNMLPLQSAYASNTTAQLEHRSTAQE
jgi:hypothetical protein